VIYHLAVESELRARLPALFYRPANLEADGFVHCALEASVVAVANDYYAELSEPLLLLEIDPTRLVAETRYEAAAPIAGGGTAHLESALHFPHVYGPIDSAAILRIGTLEKGPDGYEWPRSFETLGAFLG